MKTITLNGEQFTVKKYKFVNPNESINYSTRDIYDCYDRPSDTKIAIWKYWESWFINQGCYQFGVASYNPMMFTIDGLMYVKELDCYCKVYISKTRQELYKLD